MKTEFFKLKTALVILFSALLVGTAVAFFNVYTDKGTSAHAESGTPQFTAVSTVLTSVGELGVTSEGYRIIDNTEYFNISYTGTNNSVVTFNGLSERGYKAVEAETATPSAIKKPFVVQIPDGVTAIKANAFDYCPALHGVYFPDTVTSIGNWSFRNCSLTSVELPANLQTMLGQAFAISDLEKITVRKSPEVTKPTFVSVDSVIDGVTHEGSAVVRVANKRLSLGTKWTDLSALAAGVNVDGTTVQITRLHDRAFCMRKLDSITIPKGITAMGNSPFLWSVIEHVNVEAGHTVYKVEDNCLLNLAGNIVYFCANQNVVIPDGVKTVAAGSFRNDCKSISLPDTVTNVSGNIAIAEVEHVTMRGAGGNDVYYAEGDCLMQYEKVDDDPKARAYVRWGTANSVIPTDEKVYKIAAGAFEGLQALTSITIPDNITTIEQNTFQNTNLSSITMGKNVTSIASTAFINTPYYEDPANWDGSAFYLDTMLVSISIPVNGVYTVRDGTTALAPQIFAGFPGLTKIILPDSLTKLPNDMANGCSVLQEVEFGANVTEIGDYAFNSCPSLKSITVPDTVTVLGDGVFNNCPSLTAVYVPATLTSVGQSIIGGTSKNALLVADSYASYQSLKSGALSAYASYLTYETPVTFKVGSSTFTQTKLAGKTLDYVKSGNEWTKGALAGPGISGVNSWTVNNASGAAFNISTGIVPADGKPLTLYANLASGGSGTIEMTAPNLSTANVQLTYGSTADFNPELYGFVDGAMTVWYEGNDLEGNHYSGSLVPQNAGTYTFTFKPESGFAWAGGASDPVGNITVSPLVIDEVIWSYESTVYNGKVQKPLATYYDPFIRQYIPLATDLTAGYNGTDCGEQRITAKAEDGDINFVVDANKTKNATYNYQITRRTVTLQSGDTTEFTYDGADKKSEVNFKVLAFNDGKIAYSVKIIDKNGTAVTDAINAGKYKAVITLTQSAGNYTFKDDINYVEFTIKPAEITFDSTVKFTYDGSAKQSNVISNVTYTDDGIIKYTVKYYDNNGTEITQAINAGNYKAVVVLTAGADNYCFKNDIDYAEFEIEKAKATISWENLRLKYTGSQLLPDAFYTYTGADGNDVKQSLTVKLAKGYDGISVGVQKATVADAIAALKDNFTFVNSADGTISAYEIYDIRQLTISWGAETRFIKDGNAHLPYAYYTVDGSSRRLILDVELVIPGGASYTEAIEAGTYTASVRTALTALGYDPDDTAMVIGDVEITFTVEEEIGEVIVVNWNGSEWTFTGEAVTPAVETTAYSVTYAYFSADGKALKEAPVNAGSYTVTATLYAKDGKVAATSDYNFHIVKAKVVKPVVGVSVFSSYEEAKAYAPIGYDANTMVISGENGDGVYTVTVALKDNGNYEWVDGKTDDITFALKVSPEVSATVTGPDGVTYVTEGISKKMVYALFGIVCAAALISVIALIVAICKSGKNVIIGSSDGEGFYDSYKS